MHCTSLCLKHFNENVPLHRSRTQSSSINVRFTLGMCIYQWTQAAQATRFQTLWWYIYLQKSPVCTLRCLHPSVKTPSELISLLGTLQKPMGAASCYSAISIALRWKQTVACQSIHKPSFFTFLMLLVCECKLLYIYVFNMNLHSIHQWQWSWKACPDELFFSPCHLKTPTQHDAVPTTL